MTVDVELLTRRTSRCWLGLLVGCAVAATHMGCGGGSGSGDGPSLVVDLKGAKYLRSTPRVPPLDSTCGGLAAVGDIDGDGCTDFIVAASRQESGSAVDRGWIEAYSGKDGTLIWQVSGKGTEEAQAEGDESGYHLDAVALIDDLNGDGTPEIYARENWSKSSALLFSGRDGRRIGRFEIDRIAYLERPLFSRDVNTDGTPDLVFYARQGDERGMRALSGVDLSLLWERFDIWPEAEARSVDWLLPAYGDVNGDGVIDALLRRGLKQSNTDDVYTYEFAVLSGADFSLLKTFETGRPRVDGKTHHAVAGDLNGDAMADILMTSATGAGEDNRASFIRAISGADGTILWQVLGTQFQGGQETQLVDVKTGETTHLQPDVEFDAPVLATPDINGDGINDAATLAFAPGSGGRQKAVLLFSGADGQPLPLLQLPEGEGRILDSLVLLDSATAERVPSIAVSARRAEGEVFVAVFALPTGA